MGVAGAAIIGDDLAVPAVDRNVFRRGPPFHYSDQHHGFLLYVG